MDNKKILTTKEVKHIARLANLNLTPDEIEKFKIQLSAILDYINLLKKVKTDNIEPTSQVTGLQNVFEEDKTRPSLPVKEALRSAKNIHNDFIKVKAVFNEES